MPSPESPANRIVTRSRSWSCGFCARVSVGIRSSAGLWLLHPLVRSWGKVEELLGERFGEIFQDLLRPDDADEAAVVVEQRHVPIAARLHQRDRVPDGLLDVEVVPRRGHHRLDRLAQVDVAADDPGEDIALGQDAYEATI